MEKFVIALSRQFASLGRSVAQELSEQMQISFLDRDIVEETAKRMNVSVPQISQEEETGVSPFMYRMYPLGIGVPSVKDTIFQVQKSIIQDFAKKESCIIVGRCGGYCLKDHPNLLKVYIYAPEKVRLQNCVTHLGMSEKEGAKMIREIDNAREHYHRTYIPGYKNAALDSDLCINTGTYDVKQAAALIKQAAMIKFGL